jgi:outer membrane protein assembly factor BamB
MKRMLNHQRTSMIFTVAVEFALTATFLSAQTHAEKAPDTTNWHQWRGPSNNGSTAASDFETKFDDKTNLAWKVELPGKGCSTPIVWQGRIYFTSPVKGQDSLLAYDVAGTKLWASTVGTERKGKHRNGSGSNPSAITDGSNLYVYFKSGNLAGIDFEGKVLWSTNLQKRFGKDTLYWDLGTSPVLTKTHVVVAVMHGGESFLAAFDKKTGTMAWKEKRQYKTPVENDHSYTTPILYQRDGKEHLLVWGAEHVTAHEASTGKTIWSCAGFNPNNKKNWVAVASPVLVGDILVVPYGRGSQTAGIKLGGNGDVTKTHRAWTRNDTGAFVPTPSSLDGKVYMVRDRGEVVCLDAKTGKTEWTGKFPRNRNNYYSSPMVAGDKIYAAREDGLLFVAQIKPAFKMLSENNMGQRVIASPVPVGKHLLIRGETHLFCIAPPAKAN